MAVSFSVSSRIREVVTPSGRTAYALDGTVGYDVDALVAACYSASCRPPTSGGTGGSVARGTLRRLPLDPGDPLVIEAVSSAVQRRVQRDVAENFGPMADALWRRKRGYDADAHLLAIADGDPEALASLARFKLDPERYVATQDTALLASVDEALKGHRNNESFRNAVERFGEVPVVVAESIGGLASGRYLTDAILLSEMAGGAVSAPLNRNGLTVGGGLQGIIAHEYGHHVQSMMPEADDAKWAAVHSEWAGRLGGPADVDRVVDAGELPSGGWPAHGVSVYARTNGREAFAEVFAMVTHPDFKRDSVDPEALPMVDVMLEILK